MRRFRGSRHGTFDMDDGRRHRHQREQAGMTLADLADPSTGLTVPILAQLEESPRWAIGTSVAWMRAYARACQRRLDHLTRVLPMD